MLAKLRFPLVLVVMFAIVILSALPLEGTIIVKAAAQSSNGCGPEGFGGLVPDLWFTSACNAHDICYGTRGNAKSACDSRFYGDMKAICANRYGRWYQAIQRGACYASAWTYYEAVKQFGQSAYDNAQRGA